MVKKIKKYAKFVVCMGLILGLMAPSYAALSASDGSAFVTKAEFDNALADFNARLTTFEAGINSKIDSQVTSYLDRNGIWSGKEIADIKNYVFTTNDYSWPHIIYNCDGTDKVYSDSTTTDTVIYTNAGLKHVTLKSVSFEFNKSGLLFLYAYNDISAPPAGGAGSHRDLYLGHLRWKTSSFATYQQEIIPEILVFDKTSPYPGDLRSQVDTGALQNIDLGRWSCVEGQSTSGYLYFTPSMLVQQAYCFVNSGPGVISFGYRCGGHTSSSYNSSSYEYSTSASQRHYFADTTHNVVIKRGVVY